MGDKFGSNVLVRVAWCELVGESSFGFCDLLTVLKTVNVKHRGGKKQVGRPLPRLRVAEILAERHLDSASTVSVIKPGRGDIETSQSAQRDRRALHCRFALGLDAASINSVQTVFQSGRWSTSRAALIATLLEDRGPARFVGNETGSVAHLPGMNDV